MSKALLVKVLDPRASLKALTSHDFGQEELGGTYSFLKALGVLWKSIVLAYFGK